MAQRLLDEQQSNQTSDVSTGDFSTLAWKFNNLNSTAKMLLVGASPSSVPFIPISELADSDSSSVTTYQTPAPNSNLSISSLSNPSIATKQPNFYAGSKTLDTDINTKVTYTQSPSSEANTKQSTVSEEAPFKTGSYIESSQKIGNPVAAKEKLDATRNIPITQETTLDSKTETPTIEPEVSPEQETTFDNAFNVASISQGNAESIEEKPEQASVSAPSWSYKGIPAEEEEEYYSLKEELSKKQSKAGVGPFLRGTVKSAAIISLIALLGFGAYNLLKKSPEQDIENYINDQDEFDEDLNTDPLSDRVEQIDGSGLSNKTFFEEESNTSSSSESSYSEVSSSSNSSDTYYQPVVRSKPKTIKPNKPKVYTSPARTVKPKASTQQSSTTNPYSTSNNPYTSTSSSTRTNVATSSPTAFLYDPSTIYDSSSTEAISPSTYTPERFPIEISYAKSSSLYEAPLNPYNDSTTQANTIEASSYAPTEASSNLEPQETVSSGYPTFQTSPYKQQGVIENNQNIQQDTTGKLESVPVVSSPTAQSTNTSNTREQVTISNTNNSAIESSNESTPTYPQLKTPVTYQNAVDSMAPATSASQAIYSKPVSNIDQELDIQANQDDMDLSVPVLRQPVQSSSNSVKELNLDQPLPSPYNTNGAPLTTSNFVTQDSNKVQLSSSQTKPQKGRVSRFFDRFKSTKSKKERANLPSRAAQKQAQRSYQNQISSIEKRAQSPDLTDFERQKLISEIEELKGKIVSNNNSVQRSIDLNRKINNLEKDANSVYIEPSPYNGNGSDNTTLNIS